MPANVGARRARGRWARRGVRARGAIVAVWIGRLVSQTRITGAYHGAGGTTPVSWR